MRSLRTTALVGAVLSLTVLLGACNLGTSKTATTTNGNGASSAHRSADAGTLHLAYLADMSTPDPDVFYDIEGNMVILSTYEGLAAYKPGSTQVVPRLATSWQVSPDGLTYTFHLRSGVVFHDGTPFDSAAAKASFERRLAVNNAPSYMLAPIKTMSTPDPLTFVVTLKSVVTAFLDYLASSWGPKMMSPTILTARAGKDHAQSWLKDHDAGTGPFTLTAFARGDHYALTRFAKYWGTKPAYSAVDIRITPDVNSQILALRQGDLDVMTHSFPTAELASVQGDANLKIANFDSFLTSMIYFNVHKKPFDSLATRKLAAGLIGRDALVKEVYGAYGTPAASMYPAGILAAGQAPLSYPPASGKVTGSPKVDFAYTADDSGIQKRLAELIQQKLSAAGFVVTIRQVQNAQTYDFPTDVAHAPDMLLETNSPDAAHPDTWARILWGTGGGLNFFNYSNPAVDALLDKGRSTTDHTASYAAYAQAGELMAADSPIMFLASTQNIMVLRKNLTDVQFVPAYPWALDLAAVDRTS